MSSQEGLPVNNVVGTSIDLNPRDTQAASNSASSSQNADSAAASADAAWKFSRIAQGAAGDSATAVSDAEAAALAALAAAQNATITSNLYPSLDGELGANVAIEAGIIPNGALFNVSVPALSSPPRLADEYKNVDGVATLTGQTVINSLQVNSLNDIQSARTNSTNHRLMARDGVAGFAYPFLDRNGKVVGVKVDGGFYASNYEIPPLTGIPPRDIPRFIPVLQSTDGTIGIGFNPSNGLTDVLLSDDSIRYIADNIGGVSAYLPLNAIRGTYTVSAVRRSANFNVAVVQDRGLQQYDGKQRITGSYDTIVIDRLWPMEFDATYGQSNAGQGGTAGVMISGKLWPHTALSFDGRFQMQGNNGVVDGNTLNDLVPVYDPAGPTVGQYPSTMRNFSWSQLQCDNGIPQTGVVTASAWQGSTAASGFLPGTNNYANLMTFATRAKYCAELYGRAIECKYLTYIQGENGTNWTADFTTMVNAVLPALQTTFGQSYLPKIALWQIVGAAPDNGVGQQQLAVSLSMPDKVQLVGAMYPFPLGVGETLHLGPLGRMMQGDVQAEFRLQVAKGNTWQPLTMSSAVRSGTTVTITTALPPGTRAVEKDSYTPTVAQDGFVYRDDGGETAITNIVYSGNTITLTLASTPTGANPRIRYGMDKPYDAADWYALAGKCCAVSRSVSSYYRLGYNVPKYIQHALIRAQIGVS